MEIPIEGPGCTLSEAWLWPSQCPLQSTPCITLSCSVHILSLSHLGTAFPRFWLVWSSGGTWKRRFSRMIYIMLPWRVRGKLLILIILSYTTYCKFPSSSIELLLNWMGNPDPFPRVVWGLCYHDLLNLWLLSTYSFFFPSKLINRVTETAPVDHLSAGKHASPSPLCNRVTFSHQNVVHWCLGRRAVAGWQAELKVQWDSCWIPGGKDPSLETRISHSAEPQFFCRKHDFLMWVSGNDGKQCHFGIHTLVPRLIFLLTGDPTPYGDGWFMVCAAYSVMIVYLCIVTIGSWSLS